MDEAKKLMTEKSSEVVRGQRCALRRIYMLGLCLAALTANGSCDASRPADTAVQPLNLQGEWAVDFTRDDDGIRDRRSRDVTGRIVIDDSLPQYGTPDSQEALIGRLYVDRNALLSGKGRARTYYAAGENADRGEEIHANRHPDNSITIEVAPWVAGDDLVLTAPQLAEEVQGRWIYFSHSDTLASGTFRMRQVSRSAATDSAFARAQRAADRWDRLKKE